MKAIYCSALLITLLAAPGYADTAENSAAESQERGLSIVVDIDRDAAGDSAARSADLQQLQEKAYAKLGSIIDATGDQMSAEEKAEARQDIRQALDALADVSGAATGGVHLGSGDDSASVTDMLMGMTAITLIFGLIANMFTAVFMTRMVFDFMLSRGKTESLSI